MFRQTSRYLSLCTIDIGIIRRRVLSSTGNRRTAMVPSNRDRHNSPIVTSRAFHCYFSLFLRYFSAKLSLLLGISLLLLAISSLLFGHFIVSFWQFYRYFLQLLRYFPPFHRYFSAISSLLLGHLSLLLGYFFVTFRTFPLAKTSSTEMTNLLHFHTVIYFSIYFSMIFIYNSYYQYAITVSYDYWVLDPLS